MPDMIALDEDGLPRAFGSRRHYCFSHEGYRDKCRQIVTKLAEVVGTHPPVYAWQIDNEYGCPWHSHLLFSRGSGALSTLAAGTL